MRTLLLILTALNFYISSAQTIPVYTPNKKQVDKPLVSTKKESKTKAKMVITDGYIEKSSKIANDISRLFRINGSYYSGDIINGKANGYGKLYNYSEELLFEGYFENNDVINGKERYKCFGSYCGYEGDFKNGKRNGKGKRYMGDDVEIGIFVDDEYISGKSYLANGDVFEGSPWFYNRPKTGKYTFENGDIYEGQLSNKKQNGWGTYTWANGEKFTGTFFNGDILGKGTMTFKNNTYKTGYFKRVNTKQMNFEDELTKKHSTLNKSDGSDLMVILSTNRYYSY